MYAGGKKIEYTHNDNLGKSGSIVTSLLDAYLDKGHILYVDNFYSSPAVFAHLFSRHTGACGTVRTYHKEMPKFTKILSKGETEVFHNTDLLALKWHDKRDVHMFSTVQTNVIIAAHKAHRWTGEPIRKPRAVDKSDMQISLADCTRKTGKWFKKLFFSLSRHRHV